MKEKAILKKSLAAILAAALILAAAQIAVFIFTDKSYFTVIPDFKVTDSLSMDPEGIVNIEKEDQDGQLLLKITPVTAGETYVLVEGSDGIGYSLFLKVDTFGIITNQDNGNFTGDEMSILVTTLFILALTIIMWRNFFLAKKNLRFSYQTMFYAGFSIWLTSGAAILATKLIGIITDENEMANFSANDYYTYLAESGWYFVMIMTPFLLAFAVFMLVSNLSLMKHERVRRANALGILVSAVMVAGEAVLFFLKFRDSSGLESEAVFADVVQRSVVTVFALAEAMLIGSIICGLMAAKHKPAYDKDYIIILGCAIRKDGTLYPLIRGRVDRAVSFYREQLEKTGKKAVFVPSGGQGSNEVISEGEAMKRYLLGQGIPEEEIMAETESANTYQNMLFSNRLIREKKADASIVFSTTNYHVFRSGILSVRAGVDTDGMGAPTKWYFWPNAFVREVLGLFSYCRKKLIFLLAIMVALYLMLSWLII